jgi:hypothetical protein
MQSYEKHIENDIIKHTICNICIEPKFQTEIASLINKELKQTNDFLNFLYKKEYLTKEWHVVSETKKKAYKYTSSGKKYYIRSLSEIMEEMKQRNKVMQVGRSNKYQDNIIPGARVFKLMSRLHDWQNPKPKRKTVVAIASSFSLY